MRRPPTIVCVPAATALVVGCLSAPHPFRGDGGGAGGDGPGTGSCAPIDPFMNQPTGTCSSGVAALSGSLIYSSSGAFVTCQWALPSVGSAVFIDLHTLTVTGASAYADVLFSLGSAGSVPTLAVSHGGSDPVHYQLLLDGGAASIQLSQPMWLMYQTVDASTISAKYSFDGASWSELGRDPLMPAKATTVTLELQMSGGSGNGSAVFANFERCQ